MTRILRRLASLLLAGFLATVAGAACSLLVDGVTAKRVTWAVVAFVLAAAVGLRGALREAS
jgi:hypothetical protein